MSSDETDSSLSSSSDEDIMCSPCDLEDMSSSSGDVDGSRGRQGQEPKYSFVQVKETSQVRHLHDSFNLEAFEDELEAYFNDLTKTNGKMRVFPKSMELSIAKQHPKVLENLKCLDLKDVFVYLGNTFVVTLNMHNKRIRIPSRLICDALVFSSNKAVLVLSFVNGQTDMARRLDVYNNFVARGVLEALRTLMNDISVIRGVIDEEDNLSSCLPELEKQAMFFNPTSISMDKVKRDAAVKSILRSVAVTQAASVFTLTANGSCGKGLCFLNRNEFEFLSEFIDMKSSTLMHTVKGQKDIIALELASRASRSGKAALHVQKSGHDEALKAHRDKHPNLDIFPTVADIECGKYKHIFAAKMDHIKGDKQIGGNICIISSSKSDFKPLKKLTKHTTKRKSTFSRFSRKTGVVHISGESGMEREFKSMPNLAEPGPFVEDHANQEEHGITLLERKPLNKLDAQCSFTPIMPATQLHVPLHTPSSLPSVESEDQTLRIRNPKVQQMKRQNFTKSDSDYDQNSYTSENSYERRSRRPEFDISRKSSQSSGYQSRDGSPGRSDTPPENGTNG
ncbi:uncharacterized protein LOC124110292 [Haliotis rufescens]|uniref:uncharacterized protein LOC124110292 n=1 Tax=Haliotis rufescens TaxID=6454 RepID=UPI00201F6285|nr:uncharacterized protein LOC124110292 [Haliotis rufescens]